MLILLLRSETSDLKCQFRNLDLRNADAAPPTSVHQVSQSRYGVLMQLSKFRLR